MNKVMEIKECTEYGKSDSNKNYYRLEEGKWFLHGVAFMQ